MNEPIWVLSEVVTAIHQTLLAAHGGAEDIRDHALLESALARPQQCFAYDASASLFQLAALYSHGIVKNHPFVDGNKRLALTIAAVFLELNGFELNADEAEAVVVFERLAGGRLSEADLTAWLDANSSAVD